MATGGRAQAAKATGRKVRTDDPVVLMRPVKEPKAAKKVFSMDAVRAEARKDPFMVERNGYEWSLPRATALPLDLAARLDEATVSAVSEVLAALLGDQWDEFIGDTPLEIGETSALVPAWLEHSGVDQGE